MFCPSPNAILCLKLLCFKFGVDNYCEIYVFSSLSQIAEFESKETKIISNCFEKFQLNLRQI